MIWWPSEVYACEGNHNFSLPDPVYKNGFALTMMTSELIKGKVQFSHRNMSIDHHQCHQAKSSNVV